MLPFTPDPIMTKPVSHLWLLVWRFEVLVHFVCILIGFGFDFALNYTQCRICVYITNAASIVSTYYSLKYRGQTCD